MVIDNFSLPITCQTWHLPILSPSSLPLSQANNCPNSADSHSAQQKLGGCSTPKLRHRLINFTSYFQANDARLRKSVWSKWRIELRSNLGIENENRWRDKANPNNAQGRIKRKIQSKGIDDFWLHCQRRKEEKKQHWHSGLLWRRSRPFRPHGGFPYFWKANCNEKSTLCPKEPWEKKS